MNFLKIALGDDVSYQDSAEWKTIPFTENIDIAELAAIVLDEHDTAAIKIANNLQQASGLVVYVGFFSFSGVCFINKFDFYTFLLL